MSFIVMPPCCHCALCVKLTDEIKISDGGFEVPFIHWLVVAMAIAVRNDDKKSGWKLTAISCSFVMI